MKPNTMFTAGEDLPLDELCPGCQSKQTCRTHCTWIATTFKHPKVSRLCPYLAEITGDDSEVCELDNTDCEDPQDFRHCGTYIDTQKGDLTNDTNREPRYS